MDDEFDEEGNLIAKRKKKIEHLPPVDHSAVQYIAFCKQFYKSAFLSLSLPLSLFLFRSFSLFLSRFHFDSLSLSLSPPSLSYVVDAENMRTSAH